MSLDLGDELARLARSAHDDATTARMTGQVRHMVTRVRRRRAARRTATGAVGLGAAAAVAVAGVQLAGRPIAPPAGPPATGPDPTAPVTAFGACGAPVVDPTAGADPTVGLTARLGEVTTADGAPTVSVTVGYTGDTGVLDYQGLGVVLMVAARDQVVVSPVAAPGVELQSMPPQYGFEMPMVSCEDGAALPEGSYELYALQQVSTDAEPGLEQVWGGPWVVSIGEPTVAGPTAEPEPAPGATAADGQAALDALLAGPAAPNPGLLFPQCGTVASEALDDGMPPLELDLTESSLSLPAGGLSETVVRLHTTEGRYVIGSSSPVGRIALIKDGIVVGYQWLDPTDVLDVDLADGQVLEVPARVTATVCGTGEGGEGPALPLPPGEYEAIAALDVMLKEVGYPDAEPEALTYTITAVGEPGVVVVTAP